MVRLFHRARQWRTGRRDSTNLTRARKCLPALAGAHLIPPPKARERTAAVCGAPAAAARRGQAFSDNSATLGIRTCCGWSFGHSRDPVVVQDAPMRLGRRTKFFVSFVSLV